MSLNGRSMARRLDRVIVRSRARSDAALGRLCLPNRPESVALVRRLVVLVAEAYGVAHVGETAALLVSELATNATKHAQSVVGGCTVEVVVIRRTDRLRVEVRDQSPHLPVTRSFEAMDEDGRGLFLVEELADGYGTYRMPDGKAVWFELIAWGDAAGDPQDSEGARSMGVMRGRD